MMVVVGAVVVMLGGLLTAGGPLMGGGPAAGVAGEEGTGEGGVVTHILDQSFING